MHEGFCQLLDARRVSGGEQQGLATGRSLANHFRNIIEEAHVEHAVRFVQHQGVEPVEAERAFAQVLEDAPGCAHPPLGTMLQGADLRADGLAAAEGQHLDVAGTPGQTTNLDSHLVCQLPRGAKHQGLAAVVAQVEWVQQSDAKGSRFAAAGAGLGNHIPAFQQGRQAGRLYRCHGRIAQCVQVGEHVAAQWQGGKQGISHVRARVAENQGCSVPTVGRGAMDFMAGLVFSGRRLGVSLCEPGANAFGAG